MPSVNMESDYCYESFDKKINEQNVYDDFSLGNIECSADCDQASELDQNNTLPTNNDILYEDTSQFFATYVDQTIPKYADYRSSVFNLACEEEETHLKKVVPSQIDSTDETVSTLEWKKETDENPYLSLLVKKQQKLVNLKTWESDQENLKVLEEFCFPCRMNDKTVKELIEDINSGEIARVMESIKYVHAVSIPSAVVHIDLPSLSTLADCYDSGIEKRTAREIQNILFHTEVGRHSLDALLESVGILLGVVRRRAASPDTLRNTLPNVMIMLLLVHHMILYHCNKAIISDMVKSKLANFMMLLEEIEYPQTAETELHLINAVKMSIGGLEKVLNRTKANRLQIGSWKDELQKDSSRTKLAQSLTKMTAFEHYSLIARLFIELHQRLVEKHMKFLFESLKSIKSKLKKTDGAVLYPLLVVVFRGVTSILNHKLEQDRHRDTVLENIHRTCIDILKMSLRSAKISLECKQDLSENLNSILFHKSETVASAVSELIIADKGFCLADKLYQYMLSILEPLSFSKNSDSQERRCLPRWEDISGTITGHKEVNVHVLLPANGTIGLHQYHRSAAKDVKTGMHYNTLEILRSLLECEHHPNLKRLIAFQCEMIPMFYMTEKLSDASLSMYLLRERKHRKWLPKRVLGSMALDCVKAIQFLHERKIIHRNITAASYSYRGDHSTFVLSDFSIAKQIDDGSNGSCAFIQDLEGNLIPTRWSAPETLLDDRYDVMSDTWMLGQTLFEIFTHGCHPFPEMFTFAFDDLMDMVVFHDLKPRRYPCIPLPVHNVILQCVETESNSRTTPKEIVEKLEDWMASLGKNYGQMPTQSISTITNKSLNYPELDPNQKEPEMGFTKQLRELKNMRGNPRTSYYNKPSKRRPGSRFVKNCCITEQNLTAPDHPIIKEKGLFLEVEEPVTSSFLSKTFPKLCGNTALGDLLHITRFPPEYHQRDSTNPEGLTRALSYRCKRADSLLMIAEGCKLGNPEDKEMPYLEVVYETVKFVNEMHKNGWILRDLCCSTLYRSEVNGKVFMPRLGRMIKIEKQDSHKDAFIIDKSTCVEDRRNWMPAEVIQGGQFSQASDVYMMAMTICQFYSTASLFKSNPMSSRLEAIPFWNVKPEELLESLYLGEIPNEPDCCPSWLFDILKKCWNRDSTQRPSAQDILSTRLVCHNNSTFESMVSESASADATFPWSFGEQSTISNITRIDSCVHQNPMKETGRPVPPPRSKRAIFKRQENEYVKESVVHSKTNPSIKQTANGKVESSRLENDISSSVSIEDVSSVSCANSCDGSFENSVDSLQSNCLSNAASSNHDSLQNPFVTTAFQDNTPCYQDFDPEKEGSVDSSVLSLEKISVPQGTYPPQEQTSYVYDYATSIPNSSKRRPTERPPASLPQEFDSTSTSGYSIHSTCSCANSEVNEYDYPDASPLQRVVKRGTGSLASTSSALNMGSNGSCSRDSSISDEAVSCANSYSAFNMKYTHDEIGGSTLPSFNVDENMNNAVRPKYGSSVTLKDDSVEDHDGYEVPIMSSKTF